MSTLHAMERLVHLLQSNESLQKQSVGAAIDASIEAVVRVANMHEWAYKSLFCITDVGPGRKKRHEIHLFGDGICLFYTLSYTGGKVRAADVESIVMQDAYGKAASASPGPNVHPEETARASAIGILKEMSDRNGWKYSVQVHISKRYVQDGDPEGYRIHIDDNGNGTLRIAARRMADVVESAINGSNKTIIRPGR